MWVLPVRPPSRGHRLIWHSHVPAGPAAEGARQVVHLLGHGLAGVFGRGRLDGGGAGGQGVAAHGAVEAVGAPAKM